MLLRQFSELFYPYFLLKIEPIITSPIKLSLTEHCVSELLNHNWFISKSQGKMIMLKF